MAKASNDPAYPTGERAGLHYTCINSHLTADELAYIVDNSESKVLITSRAKREIAMEAAAQPRVVEPVGDKPSPALAVFAVAIAALAIAIVAVAYWLA